MGSWSRFLWEFLGQRYIVFFPFSLASLAELCSFWCGFKDLFTLVVQVRWQCSPLPLKLMTSQVAHVEGMWLYMGHSEVNGLKYIVLFLWVNMEEVGGGGCWGDYAHLACLDNQWKPMFYLILLSLNNNMIINIHSTPSHLIFLRDNWQCMWQNKCFGMLKKM